MPRKSKKPVRKQTHSPTGKVVGQVGQILLPMIAGIAATKADLTEWVYEQGLTALHLLLREDAEEIAGLKGKHEKERTHNHCGSTNGELSFGGRRIQVSRPRVRSDVSRGPWKKNGTLHSVIRVSYQAATSARSRTSLRRW